jgi:hypothetical protein
VRAQTFRGAKSEGFWIPRTALSFAINVNSPLLSSVGDRFTEAGGVPICNKYITTKTFMVAQQNQRTVKKGELKGFPKHYDTEQFRYGSDDIPLGSLVWITEKLHGTSHRFGCVAQIVPTNWFLRLLGHTQRIQYSLEHGTRNVILGATSGTGYYGSDAFRFKALMGVEPRKGEVLYGEIVGFHAPQQPIMPPVDVPKELSDISKRYGAKITYSYGQSPGQCKFYCYRILQFNEDGQCVELTPPQVRKRCHQLQIECVPSLTQEFWQWHHGPSYADDGPVVIYNDNCRQLLKKGLEVIVEGPSTLDSSHLREGVIVHVLTPDGKQYALKHKSFAFKVLEGIIKLDDSVADMEEFS